MYQALLNVNIFFMYSPAKMCSVHCPMAEAEAEIKIGD